MDQRITYSSTVTDRGQIQVRRTTADIECDQVVATRNHLYIFSPGDDLKDQPQEIVEVAKTTWTKEVTAAWQKHKEALRTEMLKRYPPPPPQISAQQLFQQIAAVKKNPTAAQALIDALPPEQRFAAELAVMTLAAVK